MKQTLFLFTILLYLSSPHSIYAQVYDVDNGLLKNRLKIPKAIQGRWYSKENRVAIEFQDYGVQIGSQFWTYHKIHQQSNEIKVSLHREPNIEASTTILLDMTQPDLIQVKCGNLVPNCQEGFIKMKKWAVNPETLPQFKNYLLNLSRPSPPIPEKELWKVKYQHLLQEKLTDEWFANAQRLDTFPEKLQGFWNCANILPAEERYDTFCLAIFQSHILQDYFFNTYNGTTNIQSDFIDIDNIYYYNDLYFCSSNDNLGDYERPVFLFEFRNDSLLIEPLNTHFYETEPILFTNKQALHNVIIPQEFLGIYTEINPATTLPFFNIKMYAKEQSTLSLSPTDILFQGQYFRITNIFQNNFYPAKPNSSPNYTFLAIDTLTDQKHYFLLEFDPIFKTWNMNSYTMPSILNGDVVTYRTLKFRKSTSFALYVTQRQLSYITIALLLSPLFIIFLIIAFIAWFRAMRRKRKQSKLALQGIRAQLNPHFLFNALNSIQSLVNQQDTESANKYLSGFSRLMRHTLDNSAQDYLPLQEEIEALEQYCKLEALRSPFEYRIEVDPNIDPFNTEIPNMLLQPYIENAILHGLRDHPGQPLLEILIFKQGKKLICIITDNGPGIRTTQERARGLTAHQQKQYGLKLSEERIQLLNLRRRRKITLQIMDRQAVENQSGTKVIVTIPE